VRRATTLAAAVLAALAIGACGDSPEDEAREDGEQLGKALRDFSDAESAEERGAAIDDFRAAVESVEEDTAERVRTQVETQRATLEGAGEDVQGAIQELRAQADAFRSGNDSIANEFWRGFEEGYDD
jgi:hypothetical protein